MGYRRIYNAPDGSGARVRMEVFMAGEDSFPQIQYITVLRLRQIGIASMQISLKYGSPSIHPQNSCHSDSL